MEQSQGQQAKALSTTALLLAIMVMVLTLSHNNNNKLGRAALGQSAVQVNNMGSAAVSRSHPPPPIPLSALHHTTQRWLACVRLQLILASTCQMATKGEGGWPKKKARVPFHFPVSEKLRGGSWWENCAGEAIFPLLGLLSSSWFPLRVKWWSARITRYLWFD